jgi:hypothetical protein
MHPPRVHGVTLQSDKAVVKVCPSREVPLRQVCLLFGSGAICGRQARGSFLPPLPVNPDGVSLFGRSPSAFRIPPCLAR